MIKKEYPSIYFLKGISSVLVVLIHAQFFFHDLYVPVYRLAVPLFFMISGFFLIDETGNLKVSNINKAIKKMLKINIITSVVYILFSYFRLFILNENIDFKILYPDDFLLKIFLGHPYCGVLWYVTAYIEILLVLKLFHYFHKDNLLYYLIPIFCIIALLVGKYSFLIDFESNHFIHRNFFVMGLPFVLMGMSVKKYNLSKYTSHLTFTLLLLLGLSYLEYFFLKKFDLYREGDLVLTSLFLAPVAFIWFLNCTAISKENILSVIGKKYSLNLYLYHPMVISIFYMLNLDNVFHEFEYPIVLFVTLLGCIIAPKIKAKMINCR